MDNKHQYLNALGIHPWESRNPPAELTPIADAPYSIEEIPEPQCDLHQIRTQTVFGVGNRNAELMIIGEALGSPEHPHGEPFVGRAGQLLATMIQAMGFDRSQVYIANIVKLLPSDEVQSRSPYLDNEITLIQPRLLLAVGSIASHYLLKTQSSLESLRQKVHAYNHNLPLIVTYHPADLLRNSIDKKKAFLDIQLVQKTLRDCNHGRLPDSAKQAL
jgi:DNA polymerase